MASIHILDDSRAGSALLKLTLTRLRHCVSRTTHLDEMFRNPCGSVPDLVLINHAFRNHSGWQVFNRLKRDAPHIPAMVYVPAQLSSADVAWIVKAVEAAICNSKCHAVGHRGDGARDSHRA